MCVYVCVCVCVCVRERERERERTLSTRPREAVLLWRVLNSTNQSSGSLKGDVETIYNSLLVVSDSDSDSGGLSICSGVGVNGDDLPLILGECFHFGCPGVTVTISVYSKK